MFGWLKRGKPAHPMANPEHVQELIASLSASDPAKALERISGWLDGVTHAKAPDERDETVVVMRIAGEAKEAAAGHYLAIQRLTMQFNEARPYVRQPPGLMEGGEDFDCGRFRVLRS